MHVRRNRIFGGQAVATRRFQLVVFVTLIVSFVWLRRPLSASERGAGVSDTTGREYASHECGTTVADMADAFFTRRGTQAHYMAIELRVALALYPALCASDMIAVNGTTSARTQAVMADIGVHGNDNLHEWMDLFATSEERALRSPRSIHTIGVASARQRYCRRRIVKRFALVEPSPEKREEVGLDVMETFRRRDAAFSDPIEVSVFMGAIGADQLEGASAQVHRDGTVDLKKTQSIRNHEIVGFGSAGHAEQWVPVLSLTRVLRAAAVADGTTPGEAQPEVSYGRVVFRRFKHVAVASQFDLFDVTPSTYPSVPFLKISADGTDSYIIAKNRKLLNAQVVGVVVFEVTRVAASTSGVPPRHAIATLIDAGYHVFCAGIAAMHYYGRNDMPALALASIDSAESFESVWDIGRHDLTVVALHPRVFAALSVVYAHEMSGTVTDAARGTASRFLWPSAHCLKQLILLPTPGLGFVTADGRLLSADPALFNASKDSTNLEPTNELLVAPVGRLYL